MEKHELFIETLNDLELKIHSDKPYQILKSSEIIRSLLFDTTGPLVDKINREFKLKIEFEYRDTKMRSESSPSLIPKPTTYIVADGFYPPDGIPNAKSVKTKKDQFFKALLIYHNDTIYTVKDILNFALYNLGGTHHAEPNTESETNLAELNDLFLGNINSIIFQTRAIGKVVIKALSELKNEVEKKYYS
ncbi:hypothetical protein ACFQO1_05270 [Jejudonia soesokkakensis]|uniref:AbiTii domain-containing protein n=1 Tax=Jejudonia soesokkakensis TaxID=1323432 RepID=A0ABW2MSM0_9FLAO